jgi:hypothetical protein
MTSLPQVVLTMPADLIGGRVVLASALSLFHGDVEVVVLLRGTPVPTAEDADALDSLCRGLAGAAPLPDIVLLGEDEAAELQPMLTVNAQDDPMLDAQAIILLAGLAMALWDQRTDPAVRPSTETSDQLLAQLAAQRDSLAAQRDARIAAFTESPQAKAH